MVTSLTRTTPTVTGLYGTSVHLRAVKQEFFALFRKCREFTVYLALAFYMLSVFTFLLTFFWVVSVESGNCPGTFPLGYFSPSLRFALYHKDPLNQLLGNRHKATVAYPLAYLHDYSSLNPDVGRHSAPRSSHPSTRPRKRPSPCFCW